MGDGEWEYEGWGVGEWGMGSGSMRDRKKRRMRDVRVGISRCCQHTYTCIYSTYTYMYCHKMYDFTMCCMNKSVLVMLGEV